MASPGGKVAEGGDGRKVEESAPGEPDMFEVPESKQTPAVVRTGALSAEWDGSVEVVNGYRILKHLGRGAYAEALKALSRRRLSKQREFHRVNGRMKVTTALDKVMREIELMKLLHHHNIVKLQEIIDDEEDNLYLILSYADAGASLDWDASTQEFRSPHSAAKNLPEATVRQIVGDICHALVYLHRLGIVHRDIKPDNILLSSSGHALLCDFGVAHQFAPEDRAAALLTKTEGTLAFHAPECCTRTDADMDPDAPPPKATPFNTYKVDMWALGATVYAYLFGCLPFGFTTVLDLCDAILHKDPFETLPSDTEISADALDFLQRLMDRDSTSRLSAREALAHPWLAGYEEQDRVRFKALDVSAMQPAAALFLAPRIGHAESRLATTESIRHTGWLRKRGRIFATWRRRFFELNGTDLTYHDREGAPAKGQVDCAMLAAATHAPKSNKPYRFFIRSGKRDLYMQAESEEDMDGWFKVFRTIIEANEARAAHAKS